MRAVITIPRPIDSTRTAMPATTEPLASLLTYVPTDGAAPDYESRAFERAAFQLALRIAEVIRIQLDDEAEHRGGDAVTAGHGDRSLRDDLPRSRPAAGRARLRLTRPSIRWPEVQPA